MAGCSGTPLLKKLGIKPRDVVYAMAPPTDYVRLLGPLPDKARIVSRMPRQANVIHLFCKQRTELERLLPSLRERIVQDGMVWVSWPKKASGIPSSITEDVIRSIALPLGLVDIKVCAVDEVWSGLKLVIRLQNRKTSPR